MRRITPRPAVFALVSFLVLPLAASAVPIQATGPSSASGSVPGGSAGARRPALIPTASPTSASTSQAGPAAGPRRPSHAQMPPLTAER